MPDTFHFTEDSYGQSIISLFKETGCEYHYGPEIEAVILFGSRAKGCYKKGSDIDLAIKGAGITHNTVLLLKSELKDYADRFSLLSLPVVKIRINFSTKERGITEWKIG